MWVIYHRFTVMKVFLYLEKQNKSYLLRCPVKNKNTQIMTSVTHKWLIWTNSFNESFNKGRTLLWISLMNHSLNELNQSRLLNCTLLLLSAISVSKLGFFLWIKLFDAQISVINDWFCGTDLLNHTIHSQYFSANFTVFILFFLCFYVCIFLYFILIFYLFLLFVSFFLI